MRRRPLPLVLLAAVLALPAACGGDDSAAGGGLNDEEQAYADAMATSLSDDSDGFGADPEDAACFAEAAMAVLGTGPFEDADLGPDDLDGDKSPGDLLGAGVVSDDQAAEIATAWGECTDVADVLAASAAADFELDAEGITCFADGLREDGLAEEIVESTFTGPSEAVPEDTFGAVLSLADECSGGSDGGLLADSIAQSLVAGGGLTEAQARCVAEATVADLGADRLFEMTAGGGSFEEASPQVQAELATAFAKAAGTCDVPLDAVG